MNRHQKAAPPQVRPKLGPDTTVDKKLGTSAGYLAAQTQGDPQNKLGALAATLSTARKNLTDKLGLGVDLKAQVDANAVDIVAAIAEHDAAMVDYVRGAARFAGTDALLLAAVGVASAKRSGPKKGVNDVPDAPTQLVISPGASPGDVGFKCRKVADAGAYVFEYKLEPSQPGDPWLPGGGIQTKRVSATVSGLAPSQQIRGRVRAIGAVSSAWSEEVVGRAR